MIHDDKIQRPGSAHPARRVRAPFEWYTPHGGNAEAGADFLGSQGDIWDAQKDMLMDALGAVVSIMLFRVLRGTGSAIRT